MKGYWVIVADAIGDEAARNEYVRLWKPIAEKYLAKVNPANISPVLKETRTGVRVTIVEFPSLEAAKACYDDPAYAEAKVFAIKSAGRDLIIVAGDLG